MNTRDRRLAQLQPLKNSGETMRFEIDRTSHGKLQEAGAWFESRGKSPSNSLLCRRALRLYAEHLSALSRVEGLEDRQEVAERELAKVMAAR